MWPWHVRLSVGPARFAYISPMHHRLETRQYGMPPQVHLYVGDFCVLNASWWTGFPLWFIMFDKTFIR